MNLDLINKNGLRILVQFAKTGLTCTERISLIR